jgi:glutamate-1-semialdehyde 2,1-aminomutase
VEPVVGNMGLVLPEPGFLAGLRDLTRAHGAVLIFDEVMTGFRVAPGGAQELYGITPDLTTLGKILGGGLPCAAFGGRADIMNQLAPLGPVYQAGTLSGNPLAMAAGIATVGYLLDHRDEVYPLLESLSDAVTKGIASEAAAAGVPMVVNRVGAMFTWFFTGAPVTDYASAARSDTTAFARFHRAMLEQGVWLPCSQFEAAFLGSAHSPEDIRETVAAAKAAFAAVGRSNFAGLQTA